MIIIPMAGLSSRFTSAGYELPKYMLKAHGKTLFAWALLSFKKYFNSEEFLFVVRDIKGSKKFIEEQIKVLGIRNFIICTLENPTTGQAETVYKAIENKGISAETQITIFNIDTFRPGFEFPESIELYDGYLEVFKGNGSNWSYAKPVSEKSTRVALTAEKKEISDLCSTGLYYFRKASFFTESYLKSTETSIDNLDEKERYIAPLYNHLIEKKNLAIHYHLIEREDVIFCGIPDEYISFLKKENRPAV